MIQLHWIDVTVLVIYFIGILGFGLYLSRREAEKGEDFFVAGRSLGWVAIGASLFASNISSEHLIGLAADGFRTGLGVGNYEWGAVLILLLLGGVFVPFYVGAKIKTIPEYLELRFGTGARVYLSLVTIVANVLVRISVGLYAGALVLHEFFGVGFWFSIIALSFVTVVYTAVGGLKAVVYTDVVQTVVLLTGTVALTWIALDQIGGWNALKAQLDPSYFDMIRPANDPEMPWTGLVLGVPILGVWYWCTDQAITQRVLGAKSVQDARYGTLLAAFLKILPVFLFILPGLCGKVLFPDAEAKSIFPILVKELLPVGLTGVVAAALIAALMSSLDSTLNSTATLVSLDFFKRFRSQLSEQKVVWIGRLTTVIVLLFGMAWVLVVQRAESLFQYLQQVNAAISPPIAAVFLAGIFWPRANHTGALSALVGGLFIGVGLLVAEPFPFLISAGVTFFCSMGLLAAGSLLTPAPHPEKIQNLTWKNRRVEPIHPFYFRMMIAILVVMAILWFSFS